ncbi:(2Fe-2S)-binding protein [Polynucleobacter sp. IMCC30063]|uniref:(2Fe-2S)-binding protein n=1 Tax=unclassified Polynucleobacter TaxID=2640945 RepID=UPI0010D44CCD|nr:MULTISPECIES: (2Fe-2S)-binding protein [unclassified Polynucleobacter]MCE7506523.1 (2Fe-2S)-binding protein [Polynucleobacter sp. IMCC30063]MCE7527467.1 (2Fe-2S)-binding protein [Polynucleobacter sp. IMCC 30228]GDX24925.1 (2Fe-2S)-binding protein [Actinomycetes bacterium]
MKSHLVKINLNGVEREGLCESRTTLLDFIRHDLGATGTHAGCEHGVCGACTVEVDQQIIRSCLMFACQADGSSVNTVEGIAKSGDMSDLQNAFKKHHALQCGFCTSGFLISADDLLKKNPNPTETEVREGLSGNLCRCTGYVGIIEAVLEVASTRARKIGGEHA